MRHHDGPLGTLAATQRHIALPFVEIYHFDAGGQVLAGRTCFDQLALLAQLGVEIPV